MADELSTDSLDWIFGQNGFFLGLYTYLILSYKGVGIRILLLIDFFSY